jgi:hypothetical protein
MKKIIFLLCIFLLVFILYSSTIESLELLPLEQADINSVSLNLKLPTEVDRYSCNNGYKYCYNGDLKKKDVFGNSIDIEGSDYNYGKTYNDISYDKVYLSDFKQNESLSSSSKTRDVYYDPHNICNKNDPWHLKLPLETTSEHICTSEKDKENYEICLKYETPCKSEDIQLEENQIYNEYNCSDSNDIYDSLKNNVVSYSRKTIEIGTYKDEWRRGLDVNKGRVSSVGKNYDTERCGIDCSGYNYFALQNGEHGNPQCFCGNSLIDATRYGPKLCNKLTGGAWCNSIHKNVCSFITTDTTETSTVCQLSGDGLVYNEDDVKSKCRQQNCTTEYYINPDLSQCYSSESEASYQHDNYYYLKDTTKYPFEVKPVNPNDYTISPSELKENDKVRLKIDVKNIVYSVPLCSSAKPLYANDECHPITDTVMDNKCNMNFPYIVDGSCVDYDTAIANVNDGCSQEKPYKYNGVCYASIDQVYTDKTEYIFDSIQNGLCYLKDNDIGLSCEDIYRIKDFDISMLYNPITNNYVGQLKYGDYSYIDCSGTLTKCMKDFPYEKNTKGELVPIFSINKNKTIKLPEYTKPEQYKEPPISKYINPYNSDIQSNLFIQCKSDYSTIPEENMCPKELPICKGNVNQLGFCNESIDSSQNLGSYNIHMLSCKNNYSSIPNEDMCPYNLPYCEDNICKESSLFYNR